MLAALVGAVSILPYALALAPPTLRSGASAFAVLIVASVGQTMVLVAIAAGIGLLLGPKVGLGAPLLRAWLTGDATVPRQLVASLPLAAGLGVASSLVIVALDVLVFCAQPADDATHNRSATPGLGGSPRCTAASTKKSCCAWAS